MSADWRRVAVGDLIAEDALAIGDGYRAKNDELSPTGLPFARAGNVNDGFRFDDADRFPQEHLGRVGDKVSRPGDVVFTSKGTVGRFALVRDDTEPFVYSPQLCFWRSLDKTRIEPRFLYYWVQGREFFLQYTGVKGQTDMADYVSLSDQRRMHITLPPLAEQQAIAETLGALDDEIELNRRMSETLQTIAEMLFRRAVASSSETTTLAEEFDLTMGQSPPGETYNQDGDGLLFFQGRTDFAFRYPQERVYCTAPARLARAGDTLVSVRAPVGAVNVALTPCAVGRGVAALRHKSGSASYTYYAMRALGDRFQVFESEGTVFGSLAKKDFELLPVPRFSREAVATFDAQVSPLDARIEVNERGSRTLAELRDTLLLKLISGEIRVATEAAA